MPNKAKLVLTFLVLSVAVTVFVVALVKFHGDRKVGVVFFSLLFALGGIIKLIDWYVDKRAHS